MKLNETSDQANPEAEKIVQLSTTIKRLTFLIPVYFLLAFLIVSFGRFSYPLDLVPFEDAILQSTEKFFQGQMYVEPSADYVAPMIGPGMAIVGAMLQGFTSDPLQAFRLASLLFTILLIPVLFFLFKEAVPSIQAFLISIAATGLYLSSYSVTGLWIDTAKPDAGLIFFSALFLLFWIYSLKRTEFYALAMGLAGTGLFLFKQTGIGFVAAAFFFLLIARRPRQALLLLGSSIGLISLILYLLHNAGNTEIYKFLLNIPFEYPRPAEGTIPEMLIVMGPIFAAAIFVVFYEYGDGIRSLFQKTKEISGFRLFRAFIDYFFVEKVFQSALFAFFAAAFIISYTGSSRVDSMANSWLVLFFALSVWIAFYIWGRKEKSSYISNITLSSLMMAQAVLSYYSISQHRSDIEERQATAQEYIDVICEIEGPIITDHNTFVTRRFCDSEPGFTPAYAADIFYNDSYSEIFLTSFERAIEVGRYPTIITRYNLNPSDLLDAIIKLENELEQTTELEKPFVLSMKRNIEMEYIYRSSYNRPDEETMTTEERIFSEVATELTGRQIYIYRR